MQVEGRVAETNVFKKKSLILTFDTPEEVKKFYRLFNTALICNAVKPAGITPELIRAKLKEMYPVEVKEFKGMALDNHTLKDLL